MPEYIIGAIITMIVGAAGNLYGRMGKLDHRIDELTVKVAENYVTKADLIRFEDKLDAVILAERGVVTKRVGPAIGPITNENK